jgi:hypothetical protein
MCHHCLLSEPETPSTDKSCSTRLSHALQTSSSWPPLVLRFCHREPSFRHAFTYGIRTLDLISVGYSPTGLRPHAAYRFLQLRDPRARLPTVLTSSLLRRHTLAQLSDAAPCGALPAEFSQVRGLFLSDVTPRRDDRSPRWIYPNLFGSDTSCRQLMLPTAWK